VANIPLQSGAYVLNLFNIQSGGISLLFLAFFEVITISWGYGTDRFVSDIERMVGRKILPWWAFAWKFLSPAVILGKYESRLAIAFKTCFIFHLGIPI
jgi:SNF family Na+-dependent transporter